MEMDIVDELHALADPAYREFQARLVPTISPKSIIGVRLPDLRSLAKRLCRERGNELGDFMAALPHRSYDESMLHGIAIGLVANTVDEARRMLDVFLPYVDNWAVCDSIRIAAFKRDPEAALPYLKRCCSMEEEYAVRFGIVQLMTLFLDERFERTHLDLVAGISRPEYYVNMARAWYFSYALIKQPASTIPFFADPECPIDPWTRNKALQKARESRRASEADKELFQSLKASASALE